MASKREKKPAPAPPAKKQKRVSAKRALARCLEVVRSAVPPEQRAQVTAENVHERIRDLLQMAAALHKARGAVEALKQLGLT